jgi:hypothetical protein
MNFKLLILTLTLMSSFSAFAIETIGQEYTTLRKFSAQGNVFPASRQENKDTFCYLGVGDLEGKFKPKESSDKVFEAAVLPSGSIVKIASVKKIEATRSIIIKMNSESEKIQIVIHCKPKQVELFSDAVAPEFDEVMSLFSEKDLSR